MPFRGKGGVGGSSRGEDNDEDSDEDINDNWMEYVSFIFLIVMHLPFIYNMLN